MWKRGIVLAILLLSAFTAILVVYAASGGSQLCDSAAPSPTYIGVYPSGATAPNYVILSKSACGGASGDWYLHTDHVNFTSIACGAPANVPWTIGFGPSNGNFTNICSTLPTATDFIVDVNGTSGKTFDGTIYYATQPSYITNIPYTNAAGKTTTDAPSTGYSAALDFDVGGLPNSLAITQMLGCYVKSAPSFNPSLLQLTMTPTVSGASCDVAIDPGTYGAPYYVQVGPDILSQGSGWSWTGSQVFINQTTGGASWLVSWAPAPSAPPPGGGTGSTSPTPTTTTTTVTTSANSTQATPTPASAPPTPAESLGIQYIVLLFGGIVLIPIVAFYSRKEPWVMAGVIAAGSYLLLDFVLYANGLAQGVDSQIGIPVFIDFGFIAAPMEGWLASLGPTGSVVALAVVFGALGSVPLWAKPLNDWLEKVV